MELEEAYEIIGSKDLSKFTTKTPLGYEIKGWMCRSRNTRLGSLIITHIDGEKTLQKIISFPKVHYLDKYWRYEGEDIHALEKRDGTAAIFYGLFDKDNEELLEVVPKTREMPVMDDSFQEKIKGLPETEKIKELVAEFGHSTVVAELFGEGNIHEIPYGRWGKKLCLEGIGILEWGGMRPYGYTKTIFREHDIPIPFEHLNFTKIPRTPRWKAEMTEEFLTWYEDYLGDWKWGWTHEGPLKEIYNLLENELYEDLLKNAKRSVVIEGSVWHYTDGGLNHMLKNKAISVRQAHILRAGVIQPPPIRHVLLKAREEFGEEDFKDFEKILPFINTNLVEEFDEDKVLKSQARIKSLWGNILKPRDIIDTEALQPFVEEVHKEIGEDAEIADKMRCFALKHPDLRKASGKMYQAFLESVK